MSSSTAPSGPTDTSKKTAVSDASATCEQTASPTRSGLASWVCVCPTSLNAAPSLPIHAVTVEPRRTSFSLNFPGPSNGRSNVFVTSPLALRHWTAGMPSPWTTTSTYGESESRVWRSMIPALRCAAPSPRNCTVAVTATSPDISFQTNWN